MASVTTRSDKLKVIAECKRLRKASLCPRECDCWHANWRGKYPPFCRSAMCAERRGR